LQIGNYSAKKAFPAKWHVMESRILFVKDYYVAQHWHFKNGKKYPNQ
jgi:hypothetical protein